MKVKSESEVAQCLTLSDPMDCSLPGSSNHRIFQARVLEWGAIAFSSPQPLVQAKETSHQETGQERQMGKMSRLQEASFSSPLNDVSKDNFS